MTNPNDYMLDYVRLENNRWTLHMEKSKTKQKTLGRLTELLEDICVGKVTVSRFVSDFERKSQSYKGQAYKDYQKFGKAYETLCTAYQMASEHEKEKFLKIFHLVGNNGAELPYILDEIGVMNNEPGKPGKNETETAGRNESGTDESGTDESGTDESGTDESGTDESGTDESGTDESGTSEV